MLLESPAKARLFRGETSAIFPDDLPMILPVDPHVISSKNDIIWLYSGIPTPLKNDGVRQVG